MPVSLTPVNLVPQQTNKVYFSSSLIECLGIDHNQSLRFSFGKKIKIMKIRILDNTKDEIHLSEAIINELLIPLTINKKYLVKYLPANNTLYLGPIVALLTDFHSTSIEEPHFRSIHIFCKELHQRVTEIGGIFYVFNIDDFSKDGVKGFHFENGNWKYTELPLPDVIYNRVHSRRLEYLPSFESFRSNLRRLGIPLFNDRFLSKWEVYQHLLLEDEIHPYLPDTRILTHESLYEFLNKYDTLFIKPIHGSQGNDIRKLIKEKDYISCQTSQAPVSNKYKNEDLFYQLKSILPNRVYIIQQGIPLAEYKDRTMDFRVLVHKNQRHLWGVTSLVARISAENQFVSNLAKGGTVMKPTDALNTCFNKDVSAKLVSVIKELSIQTAAALSSRAKGIIGELGIDIGVDRLGNPWIIEVNSKPSKSFEDIPVKIRPSAKAVIQFSIKLAFDENVEMEEKT